MLKQFATVPYSAVEAQLIAGKLTLKDAVRRLVESIPAQCHSQVLQYISDKRIRDGFPELLDFLHYHGVPFVVVSGGLVESVTAKLIPYRERIHAIYAAETIVAGDFLSVSSEFESPSELVAKTRVMDQYSCNQSIVIGDGITDLNIAMAADLVFARGPPRRVSQVKRQAAYHLERFFRRVQPPRQTLAGIMKPQMIVNKTESVWVKQQGRTTNKVTTKAEKGRKGGKITESNGRRNLRPDQSRGVRCVRRARAASFSVAKAPVAAGTGWPAAGITDNGHSAGSSDQPLSFSSSPRSSPKR